MPKEIACDVAVVGAGVLGISSAFWLSEAYDCSIVLIDKEEGPARHTTSRNTGMVHRPFYLDPEKRRVFARSAQKSWSLWRKLALRFGAHWSQIGTLEVATSDPALSTLQQYRRWAAENGMDEGEVEVLDSAGASRLEPEVRCLGAIHSKTDTSVSYGELTGLLYSVAVGNGVKFLGGAKVESVREERGGAELTTKGRGGEQTRVVSKFMINAAGGASLDIAHMLSLAAEYTDLHFRGEYWTVDRERAPRVGMNLYSVPKHRNFPFLDPHLIIRVDGRMEIGPNAVLVSGPYAYEGLAASVGELIAKPFERPMAPKLRLFTNREFISLVLSEWRSSLSKRAMCGRVSQFIPGLRVGLLNGRGVSGVRSSLIGASGFVPEAVHVSGSSSVHVLNYNSPGATGAPAYSAHLIHGLQEAGAIHLREKRQAHLDLWDFGWASDMDSL